MQIHWEKMKVMKTSKKGEGCRVGTKVWNSEANKGLGGIMSSVEGR